MIRLFVLVKLTLTCFSCTCLCSAASCSSFDVRTTCHGLPFADMVITLFLSTAYLHMLLDSGGIWSFDSAEIMQAIIGHMENSLCLGVCSATVGCFVGCRNDC